MVNSLDSARTGDEYTMLRGVLWRVGAFTIVSKPDDFGESTTGMAILNGH